MVTGIFTNVSVTADGRKMVMDQGTLDYGVWAEGLPELLKGSLADDRRVAHASSNVVGWISPDGNRILMRRVVPTTGEHTEARFSVRPYDGTSEAPLQAPGRIESARWVDSTSVAVESTMPDGHVHLSVVDVRTGAERNPLDLPDSTITTAVPVPNGWAWIPITRSGLTIEQSGKHRTLKFPAWFLNAYMLAADPVRGRLFVAGFNASTGDTLGVSALNLADGTFTPWVSAFAEDGTMTVLDGGDLFLALHRTENAYALYRASGPGTMQRLGAPALPLFFVSVSGDLKRGIAVQRSYNADAWMYNVVTR